MSQYIYGKNAVNNALKRKDRIIKLFILEGSKEYKDATIEKEFANKNELTKLCGSPDHQGVVAVTNEYKTIELEQMIKDAKSKEAPLIIVLDELKDPHNLGAILRTADCIGVHGVVYKKHNSVSLNSTVAKVACGAIETVPVSVVTNITATLKTFKKAGFWVVGTDVENASDYRSLKYDMPVVLVIGSEGEGVSRLVKKECDYLVKLPMLGTISSLNASVACGIILYEIHNQRYPYQKSK